MPHGMRLATDGLMDTAVYVRVSGEGIGMVMGAEIVDDWEGGCLIRAEEPLEPAPGRDYYVADGDELVAVRFDPAAAGQGPYDYAADKDRSDTRPLRSPHDQEV